MATTKIWEIYSTVQKAVNYICDYEKTDHGTLISNFGCAWQCAGNQFKFINDVGKKDNAAYSHLNDENGKERLAYHFYQSFAEGEVTPEEAHELGVELCNRMLGEDYQFVVATHIDQEHHIHNHVIFNSVSLTTLKKFHSKVSPDKVLRDYSDRICREHSLSVLEFQKGKKKWYKDYMLETKGEYNEISYRKILKENIDMAIELSPTWGAFLSRMRDAGYIVKTKNKNGEYIDELSYKGNGSSIYIKDRTLGQEYSQTAIMRRINEKKVEYGENRRITVNNKKLMVWENQNEIFTKLPGVRRSYFKLDKEEFQIKTIHGGKTTEIIIPPNIELPIYNEDGIQVKSMNSNDIFKIYDRVEMRRLAFIQKQRLNNVTSVARTIPFGLDARIKYYIRNHHVSNVKALAATINTLQREGINTRKEISNTLANLNIKQYELQEKLDALKPKLKNNETALKYLVIYNEIKEQLKDSPEDTIEELTDSMYAAASMLAPLGVDEDTDIAELQNQVIEDSLIVENLQSELKEVKQRVRNLEHSQQRVNEIYDEPKIVYEEEIEKQRNR